jgi:hypothetical protein
MANLSTSYSVLAMKADLEAVLHGTTLNQIQGIDNIFNRVARQLILDCDPQETIRIAETPVLFDQIFDYPISNLPDLKGNKIIDVRPQVNRTGLDVFSQTYAQQFDVNKQFRTAPNFTIDFNNAEKSLRVNATDLLTGITINQADGVSTNGTWTGTNASNLTTNTVNFVIPAMSSLQFDLAATATGSVQNSTSSAVDLTNHLNQSTLFWYIWLPTGSDFTSVSLSWGSSSSNYWTVTATTNWQGEAFISGWNLIGVPWISAVQTGTPTVSSTSYVQASFTHNSKTETATLLSNITSRLGQIFEILYYSKLMFRDSTTNVFQETVTDDSNLINLDTDTFPIFFNLLAYYAVQQSSGGDMQSDMTFFFGEYQKNLARYQALYKSQLQKPKLNYYTPQKPGYQKYFGSRWP